MCYDIVSCALHPSGAEFCNFRSSGTINGKNLLPRIFPRSRNYDPATRYTPVPRNIPCETSRRPRQIWLTGSPAVIDPRIIGTQIKPTSRKMVKHLRGEICICKIALNIGRIFTDFLYFHVIERYGRWGHIDFYLHFSPRCARREAARRRHGRTEIIGRHNDCVVNTSRLKNLECNAFAGLVGGTCRHLG